MDNQFSSENSALISTSNGQIGHLDLDSGTFSVIADTPVFTDIAISDKDKLFGITYENLYQIDPHDGSSTLVGSLGDDGFVALGFARGSSAGNAFYAASGSSFYRLNTKTGAASLIKIKSSFSTSRFNDQAIIIFYHFFFYHLHVLPTIFRYKV
jgi:hypothetical protein